MSSYRWLIVRDPGTRLYRAELLRLGELVAMTRWTTRRYEAMRDGRRAFAAWMEVAEELSA